MSKFNTTTAGVNKTVNKEGHVAYKMGDKAKLITQVLTSFFNEKKFYGDNSKEIKETLKSVIKTDPAFVSKLAVFARREFNMRSIAHVLTGFLANIPEGKPYIADTVAGVTVRGDDLTEILAFYLSEFGKPIPNGLRRAIAKQFTSLDEYSLAKYKGEGNALKMRDILCLCHPVPADEKQSATWKQLLEGTLPTAYTWESELSAKGNNKETWEELIASGKVGYMALLRNLRNIIMAAPSNLDVVLNKIKDPEAVKRSRQLPFRFLSAYRSIEGIAGTKVLDALEDAVDISTENITKLPGRTVIAIDNSGSMRSRVSNKSSVEYADIAYMLGFIANKICEDAIVYTFNYNAKKLDVSSRTGILYASVHASNPGGCTNMSAPFVDITSKKIDCDRVIILSDNEVNWGGKHTIQAYADQYRKEMNKNIWVHAIDLAGYGTQQFIGDHTNIIAGWSEKVLDFIRIAEEGVGTLETKIADYRWG